VVCSSNPIERVSEENLQRKLGNDRRTSSSGASKLASSNRLHIVNERRGGWNRGGKNNHSECPCVGKSMKIREEN